MLNPLKWKPEHRAGLLVACMAGAAVGVAVGFSMRYRGAGTFASWVEYDASSAIFWAIVGAIVVGAAIYCYRVFSN